MLKRRSLSLIIAFVVLCLFATAALFPNATHAQSSDSVPCPAQGVWPDGCIPVGPTAPPTGDPCPTTGKWPAGCVQNPLPPIGGVPCPASGRWPAGCIPTTQPPPSGKPLAINSFSATMNPLPDGKETIDITWDTTGADSVRVWTGYGLDSLIIGEAVGASGQTSLTYIDEIRRGYAGIRITKGDQVLDQQVNILFNCKWTYAFDFDRLPLDEQPLHCPASDVQTAVAAYQPFERGFMIWGRDTSPFGFAPFPPRDEQKTPLEYVTVFTDDGSRKVFNDLWQEGDLESDPAYQPPSGLHQPVRGFGKVWRENSTVREQIGWATAPEQAYTIRYQQSMKPIFQSGSAELYFTLPTNEVLSTGTPDWTPILP